MSIGKITILCAAAVICCWPQWVNASTAPKLFEINFGMGGNVTILGENFGDYCKSCEVIVQYTNSLRYSVPVNTWDNSRIVAELPDLNQNEVLLQLQVKKPHAISAAKSFRLRRRYSVIESERRSHNLDVGEKGEDVFPVKSRPALCGKDSEVFDRPEIKILKHRFANAQIVESPPSGCERCSPVVIRWYNEPTGSISYEMNLIGRIIQGVCKNRVRSEL